MASEDLTADLLREIRSEIGGTNQRLDRFAEQQLAFNVQQLAFNDEQRAMNQQQLRFNEQQLAFNAQQTAFNDDQRVFNDDQRAFNHSALSRFEAIETTLRDLAEQMVMMSRAIKVSLEHRTFVDRQLEDHERRISSLEGTQS